MNKIKTDLPKICIGTWPLGGDYWGSQSHSDSRKMIHAAVREDFTFFDTSPDYGKGRSEQLLGQQLPKPNSKYIISTKSFIKPKKSLIKGIENSLKRLNRDYIDYFFIHWPSSKLDAKPMIELLEKLRADDKIKNIGVSNFNLEQLKDVQNSGDVDIVQNSYNFFWNQDETFLEECKKMGIKTQIYSPLAQGILTGKYNRGDIEIDDSRNKMVLFKKENFITTGNYIKKIERVAITEGLTTTQLILKWTLSKDFIDSIIVGCRNRAQVEELKRVRGRELKQETKEKLNTMSKEACKGIIKAKNIFDHSY